MKSKLLIISILGALLSSGPAAAGPASDALGACMIDYLNGKERREMAKWVFFAMSAHPEMSRYSSVTGKLRDDSDQYVGNLITRLLTEDCAAEAKEAFSSESSVALSSAFELVGKVAMLELMADSNVSNAVSGFEKYLDKDKLAAIQP